MKISSIEEIYQHSYNKYIDLYDYFLNNCGFQILTTSLSLGYDTLRIRDYQDLNEIRSKNDVKYPPTSNYFSRIGKPSQIWFYVSDHFHASVSEMLPSWYSKIKPGNDVKIIISTWQVRHEIKVLIIPDLLNKNKVCQRMDLKAYHNNLNFWAYVCKKYRTTTLESKDIYQFTSAFANSLMDRAKMKGLDVEGIFYPSVQFPSQSNLALSKYAVDNDKIVLKSLSKTIFNRSGMLNINGKPNYNQICSFEQGFYEPVKDMIEWN